MRKNISSLLQRGNLKPKERVLLLVANRVSQEKDGKSILTEAEEHALSGGWTPANNEEVKEYNRYNEGWRLTGFAESDAQTTFLNAEVSFLWAEKFVDYALWHNNLRIFDFFKGLELEDISEDEALQLIIKNSGLELDNVIHIYAFESLSEDLKKDILALDPEAKTGSQYLDQEETIADFFSGKDKLTEEDKEKLADLILDFLYLAIKGLKESERWVFNVYFAELPALDILKKWADYNENYTKKETKELEKKGNEVIEKELIQKLKGYAEKNKKDIRDLLKETILKWLDEGLFVKEYTPIFNSDEKKTTNDQDTKLPHKEVFKKWRLAKLGAKVKIQELIDKGDLKIETKEWTGLYGLDEGNIFETHRTIKIIAGENLYNLKGDFTFAKDFKRQADVFKGLGYLILFLKRCRFMKDYATLLAFKELFKKLSKIYEIDLTYKINKWIESFKNDAERLNHELILISERIKETVRQKHNITFLKETFIKDMLIDLEKVKLSQKRQGGRLSIAGIGRYYQELKEIFDE